jgi:hypothetical protein
MLTQQQFEDALSVLTYAKVHEMVEAGAIDPENDRAIAHFHRDSSDWFLKAGEERKRAAWEFIHTRATQERMREDAAA